MSISAVSCGRCTRLACFRASVEAPAGSEHARRSVDACASHLGDVVGALRAWAMSRPVAGARLTVAAIDPYSVPRMSALGVAEYGFAFYSVPLAEGAQPASCPAAS